MPKPAARAGRRQRPPRWFVYMLECAGGRIYTGIAVDVAARFAVHSSGKGAAYTRSFPPRRILGARPCRSRGAALKLEYELKRLLPQGKRDWAASQGKPAARRRSKSPRVKPARAKRD